MKQNPPWAEQLGGTETMFFAGRSVICILNFIHDPFWAFFLNFPGFLLVSRQLSGCDLCFPVPMSPLEQVPVKPAAALPGAVG